MNFPINEPTPIVERYQNGVQPDAFFGDGQQVDNRRDYFFNLMFNRLFFYHNN